MNHDRLRLAAASAVCLPLLAAAQTGAPDPTRVNATAAPLRYQSAFADYKPWQDVKPADWRAVNDKLRDAGPTAEAQAGHGMQAPAAAPMAPTPKASAPAAQGDEGHNGGKK